MRTKFGHFLMPLTPHLIIALFMSMLVGCLHAPATPEERRTGVDLVGDEESSAPIRVGVSTRPQVIETLGNPQQQSQDGHAIGYEYQPVVSRSGFVFLGGPCGLRGYYPSEKRINEFLYLAFDDQDKVKWYLSSRERPDVEWQRFCKEASQFP